MQFTICFSAEIGDRLALVVVISAEQDQLTLDDVLCLEPELGWPALVRAERPLRYDTIPSRPMAQGLRSYNVSHSTISRLRNELA
jgi:hypothetical protein